MEIVHIDVSELKEYENNARTHSVGQISDIMRSIEDFGFNDPIEIGIDNVVISGHARLESAKRLGMTKVPTVCHGHLSESKKKAYILAANRIAASAGWDNLQLTSELKALEEQGIDLSLTGFTDDELKALLNIEHMTEGLCDPEETPGVKESVVISKLGDLWVLGRHRLLCGDSTMVDEVDKLYDGASPNLMVTDPPYGVNYDPSWRDGADLGVGERSRGLVKNDDLIEWTDTYSLFPGDVAYVWHAGRYTHIVAKNLEDCGFSIVSQIIWAKQHFALSRGDYHWQHEPCWYVVRNNKNHSWQGRRDQSTLWQIKNNNSFGNRDKEETWGHGTQKPLECMLKPIENNSLPGDWVYDPFGGSGTTLIACEKTARRCLMMELDPQYCDVIIRRWQKFTGGEARLEETGVTFNDRDTTEETCTSQE